MKIFFTVMMIAFSTLTFSNYSQAAEEHSEEICAVNNPNVCAHLGYHWGLPNSTDESKFMFHVLTNEGTITNLKVKLWMNMGGHGHGSSPVELKEVGPNKFLVSKAYFVMSGGWLVKTEFTLNNQIYNLDIPVDVMH